MHGITTVAELERFLLEHGEHVVDVLGLEVDRLERAIKVSMYVPLTVLVTMLFHYLQSRHPEVRHVDLEIL